MLSVTFVMDEPELQEYRETLAGFLGHSATFCFTLQYMPQAYKNYTQKSVKGFSTTGIIIKLVGAAFLMVNSYILGETLPVVLYGLFNVLQHSVFIMQFAHYGEYLPFLAWLPFPFIPYILGVSFPQTLPITNMIKPGAQVFSHLPQLYLCAQMKTTKGVSLATQHLNCVGGVCGLLMCYLVPPKSYMTYMIYINSLFQAISLYCCAYLYDGWSPMTPFADLQKHQHTGDNDIENQSLLSENKGNK